VKLPVALPAFATALLIGFAPAVAYPQSQPAQAQQAKRQNIVLQVSDGDPAKWNLALNNAENVQQALGKENVTVEIVAYGPGINMLKAESKVADRLNGALDRNVALLACAASMQKAKVNEADLAGGVKVIPGGVIHIMQRQRQGWAYVRP
jgi:hypothetical protein